MYRPTGIFTTYHVKSQVVKEVFEGVAEVVGRGFGHQLVSQFALDIEGVGDAVAGNFNVEHHLLTLCGFDVILLNDNLIG